MFPRLQTAGYLTCGSTWVTSHPHLSAEGSSMCSTPFFWIEAIRNHLTGTCCQVIHAAFLCHPTVTQILLNTWTGLLQHKIVREEEAAAAFFSFSSKKLGRPPQGSRCISSALPLSRTKLQDSESAPDHLATTCLLWTWTGPLQGVWCVTQRASAHPLLHTHSVQRVPAPSQTSVTPLSVSRKAVGCTFHWWVYMCQACKKSLSPVWLRTQLSALTFFFFFSHYFFHAHPFPDGEEMTAKCHATRVRANIVCRVQIACHLVFLRCKFSGRRDCIRWYNDDVEKNIFHLFVMSQPLHTEL